LTIHDAIVASRGLPAATATPLDRRYCL